MPADIHNKFVKTDKWIKSLKKTNDPEQLAGLIKERIDCPQRVGPFMTYNSDEKPTDIINAMIAGYEGFRKKLTPAIGFLLYSINNKKIKDNDLIRGVFHLISVSKLEECSLLVLEWINAKCNNINDGPSFPPLMFVPDGLDKQEKIIYRDALAALAAIQNKNVAWEEWWFSFWRSTTESFWYGTTIYALRKQNPEVAAKEIELLVKRNPDKLNAILLNMWNDLGFRKYFAAELINALKENNGWAGNIINMLFDKLFEEDKRNELMLALKNN